MLDWKQPQINDGGWIRDIISEADCLESDTSFANIYLLRNKYDIQICRYKDSLIRRYSGEGARDGYTFPIGDVDIKKALEEIENDAKICKQPLRFAFVTEQQKQLLEEYMPDKFEFVSDQGDSDYVYMRTELANLSGKAFHKKKNHVSRFLRTYNDCVYEEIGCANWEHAMSVADTWYTEHNHDISTQKEYEAIKEALNNFNELELMGGIVYVNSRPVAMTVASMISENVCDVHFEKCISEYALNGGYAFINKEFASMLNEDIIYINREEDVGIEGLRKAKMSYRPKMIVKKYSAVLKGE